MHRRVLARLYLVGVLVAGCGVTTATPSPTSPTASPIGTSPPAASATPSPAASAAATSVAPRPSGTLAWPGEFLVEMRGGYFTSPPFLVPMTIEITEAGWHAGHINPAFIDLQRYDGVELGGLPSLLLGFGLPANIRGDGPMDVDGLTPAAAIDAITARGSIKSSNRAPVEVFGLAGERVDLHSDLTNNPIFGTDDGDFGIQPELDCRLSILPLDGGLLVVAVLAPAADLEAAWTRALPILETATLQP